MNFEVVLSLKAKRAEENELIKNLVLYSQLKEYWILLANQISVEAWYDFIPKCQSKSARGLAENATA